LKRLSAAIALALALVACRGEPQPAGPVPDVLIVVNAALGTDAGRQIERGAQLAVDQLNDTGGVRAGARTHRLTLTTMDTKGSALTAADNARTAIAQGAAAIVGDGDGVEAVQGEAARLGVPVGIVMDAGGTIEPVSRPAVFRIAPAPADVAVRMREVLVAARLKTAVLHDDGPYGTAGLAALASAFDRHRESLAGSIPVSADDDGRDAVRRAEAAGAEALLLWMPAAMTARVIESAREAGWMRPIYTGPSGADPSVRVALAGRPEWMDGVVFASGRLAGGPNPDDYGTFRAAYEKRFGAGEIPVTYDGQRVVDPPRWAMYSYDFVRLAAAGMTKAGTVTPGARLLAGLESAAVEGANGATRRFTPRSHDALERDEIFFARFAEFFWAPVKDDPRSANLPDVPQSG